MTNEQLDALALEHGNTQQNWRREKEYVFSLHGLSTLAAALTKPQPVGGAPEPAELFDSYGVLMSLTPAAAKRTSPENVADVLDAAVTYIRANRTLATPIAAQPAAAEPSEYLRGYMEGKRDAAPAQAAAVPEPSGRADGKPWLDGFAGVKVAVPEAVDRDAARYRLLRRGQQWSVIDGIGDALRGEVLDAAIDRVSGEGEGS
jgi:hypothetical protein